MKISTLFKISLAFATVYAIKKWLGPKPITQALDTPPDQFDKVEEAMLESFPASDPPAYR